MSWLHFSFHQVSSCSWRLMLLSYYVIMSVSVKSKYFLTFHWTFFCAFTDLESCTGKSSYKLLSVYNSSFFLLVFFFQILKKHLISPEYDTLQVKRVFNDACGWDSNPQHVLLGGQIGWVGDSVQRVQVTTEAEKLNDLRYPSSETMQNTTSAVLQLVPSGNCHILL